jgi:hypothetical protein
LHQNHIELPADEAEAMPEPDTVRAFFFFDSAIDPLSTSLCVKSAEATGVLGGGAPNNRTYCV